MVVRDDADLTRRGVQHVQPLVLEVVADGADQAERAVAVPAEEAGGGEAGLRVTAAGRAVRGLRGGRRHPQLQPADLARREVGEAHPGLGLRVADLGARVECSPCSRTR